MGKAHATLRKPVDLVQPTREYGQFLCFFTEGPVAGGTTVARTERFAAHGETLNAMLAAAADRQRKAQRHEPPPRVP